MPTQLIQNHNTGEIGYQARARWQTRRGLTKYFSCRLYGPRKAKWLADGAAQMLELLAERGRK